MGGHRAHVAWWGPSSRELAVLGSLAEVSGSLPVRAADHMAGAGEAEGQRGETEVTIRSQSNRGRTAQACTPALRPILTGLQQIDLSLPH